MARNENEVYVPKSTNDEDIVRPENPSKNVIAYVYDERKQIRAFVSLDGNPKRFVVVVDGRTISRDVQRKRAIRKLAELTGTTPTLCR